MIIVFSGTGNSLFVAKELRKHLGDEIVTLPTSEKLTVKDERVIWVFPVYSWGVPPVVKRWISKLQIAYGHKYRHFAVMTCGDDCGLADGMWRSALARRAWIGLSAYSVTMPNTYVLMKGFDVDPIDVAEAKVKAAVPRCADIARRIKAQCEQFPFEAQYIENDIVRGRFAWIKTKIIYPWFVRFAMSPEPFYATDDCISCAVCAKNCPLKNITMHEGKPAWGKDCALCLRCYHICPRHAVAYSTATIGKGQKGVRS